MEKKYLTVKNKKKMSPERHSIRTLYYEIHPPYLDLPTGRFFSC